jgi:hypothetical protein
MMAGTGTNAFAAGDLIATCAAAAIHGMDTAADRIIAYVSVRSRSANTEIALTLRDTRAPRPDF